MAPQGARALVVSIPLVLLSLLAFFALIPDALAAGKDWKQACMTTPIVIKGKTYNKPDKCNDPGWFGGQYGTWLADDDTCKGYWDTLKDNGCVSGSIGRREWSAKLLDVTGSWEYACAHRDGVVGNEYFEKPTRCDKVITGIWGVFHTQDTKCGVPPCPKGKAWNYGYGGCASCDGTPPPKHTELIFRGSNVGKLQKASVARNRNANRNEATQHKDKEVVSRDSADAGLAHDVHVLEKRDKYCSAFLLNGTQPQYFPQNPNAWAGGAAEGPSVAEIAASTIAQAAFQEAWNDSFNTPTTARETGGWIYADPGNRNRIFIRRAPVDRSTPMNQLHPAPGVAAGIDLWNPEGAPGRPPPAGFVLVATFHTHPMGPAYGGNAANPSTADHRNAWQRGVPGIVINRRGITGYGPARRAQLNAPQGYPMSNEEYNGQGGEGTRYGTWTPTRANNQQEP
ncbi:hypothetical protein CVT24_011823 [Panaeolus cyanescens]|uniref:DUF4329 domain-containing protein n=1 Tax=Panaeolus cyanescens TaxID=181874 RepID=A0A409VHA4_9AGAR|nr:hypothetical protein CVT24_011823 [Panaeolus cyanescens]